MRNQTNVSLSIMCKALLLGIAALALVSPAQAGNSKAPIGKAVIPIPACDLFYIEVFGGANFYPDLDYDSTVYPLDNGFNIGAAVGKSLTDRIDVEFEAFFTNTSYSEFNDELDSLSLMANVFYNIPVGPVVTYLGAGAGAMSLWYEFQDDGISNDWVFGYQFIAGVRYPIADCVSLFTEYRYSAAIEDAIFYGSEPAEYRTNGLSVGVRLSY
jgi:opacity protein-like surface antigen